MKKNNIKQLPVFTDELKGRKNQFLQKQMQKCSKIESVVLIELPQKGLKRLHRKNLTNKAISTKKRQMNR
jgi:hypothetical protein